eukprot:1512175-Rhodomonas_salina.2
MQQQRTARDTRRIERDTWEGATTIDSPVWMPSGSKFSMLQTVMQLPHASRTTSYSISFHPRSDFSTRTCALTPHCQTTRHGKAKQRARCACAGRMAVRHNEVCTWLQGWGGFSHQDRGLRYPLSG